LQQDEALKRWPVSFRPIKVRLLPHRSRAIYIHAPESMRQDKIVICKDFNPKPLFHTIRPVRKYGLRGLKDGMPKENTESFGARRAAFVVCSFLCQLCVSTMP
jgi:hypothetical protein